MLFWKDLSGYLTNEGFEANPYNCCVVNKMVNGKQCTVLWHLDDLKVSHIESTVTDEVLSSLNQKYGKETPLTITRGDLHDYLGMTIDYGTEGKVSICMQDCVEDMLDDLPDDMGGSATTPAAEHLFKVNVVEAERLFHSTTKKILFLCKWARPDVQTAIAFLCSHVCTST